MAEFKPLSQLRHEFHSVRRKGAVFMRRLLVQQKLNDEARFLKSWFENPLRTGAISPSGPVLAKNMANFVQPDQQGFVLELGPGTGPVTEALLARGIAENRLVLIEFDQDFCALLRRRFPQARVIKGDAYNLVQTLSGFNFGLFAACVSSLPLMSRPEAKRVSLVMEALGLCAPGASFIQFTYAPMSPVPLRTPGVEARGSKRIWRNLPPASVWVYRAVIPAP